MALGRTFTPEQPHAQERFHSGQQIIFLIFNVPVRATLKVVAAVTAQLFFC